MDKLLDATMNFLYRNEENMDEEQAEIVVIGENGKEKTTRCRRNQLPNATYNKRLGNCNISKGNSN